MPDKKKYSKPDLILHLADVAQDLINLIADPRHQDVLTKRLSKAKDKYLPTDGWFSWIAPFFRARGTKFENLMSSLSSQESKLVRLQEFRNFIEEGGWTSTSANTLIFEEIIEEISADFTNDEQELNRFIIASLKKAMINTIDSREAAYNRAQREAELEQKAIRDRHDQVTRMKAGITISDDLQIAKDQSQNNGKFSIYYLKKGPVVQFYWLDGDQLQNRLIHSGLKYFYDKPVLIDQSLSAEELYERINAKELYKFFTPEDVYKHFTPEELYAFLTPDTVTHFLTKEQLDTDLTPEELYKTIDADELYKNVKPAELYKTIAPDEFYNRVTPEEFYKLIAEKYNILKEVLLEAVLEIKPTVTETAASSSIPNPNPAPVVNSSGNDEGNDSEKKLPPVAKLLSSSDLARIEYTLQIRFTEKKPSKSSAEVRQESGLPPSHRKPSDKSIKLKYTPKFWEALEARFGKSSEKTNTSIPKCVPTGPDGKPIGKIEIPDSVASHFGNNP